MAERQRAYRGEELVTVLDGIERVGKRGKVKIRNQHGFVEEEVDGRDLELVPDNEPHATLKYQTPSDK